MSALRFLFTTIQFDESDFYGRVAAELNRLGHTSSHATISRRAARRLGRSQPVSCLPEVMREVGVGPLDAEVARLEAQYRLPSLRDAWYPDPACQGRPERWCLERTVATFRAVERVFDESQPDVLVPEVGSETMRTAAYLVARDRHVPVLILFFTIFPNPLMIYVDRYGGPMLAPEEIRDLSQQDRREVENWIESFTSSGRPILAHRVSRVTGSKLGDFGRHLAVKALFDRDNDYLHPHRFVSNTIVQRARAKVLGPLYDEAGGPRPFVYFPLHVTDDFKIKKAIPHCVDQGYLIQQVADALPQGYDLVLKEHPWSIGTHSINWLRRVLKRPNVRLVDPFVNSHDLMQRAAAVAVIGSTVGLEALLYGKPVLTLGQPYYAGYGVTVDVDSFREIRTAVPKALRFEPDRESILRFLSAAMRSTEPGAPQGVDPSQDNALTVAGALDRVARRAVAEKEPASATLPR